MLQWSVSIIRSIIFQGSDKGLDEKDCLFFLIFEHNNSHECNNPFIMFIELEATYHHGHLEVVDKSTKIERPGGLKNIGQRSSSSSCQVNKTEQKGCQLYVHSA